MLPISMRLIKTKRADAHFIFTSSPFLITQDDDNYVSLSIRNLFPRTKRHGYIFFLFKFEAGDNHPHAIFEF